MHTDSENNIKLSIIIVTWKVRKLVMECIDSVYKYIELPDNEYEIFVVDNASDDGTVTAIQERYKDISVIENTSNVGFGSANNQVYSECKGEYVLLLNPDTLLLDNALDLMVDFMDMSEDISVMGCRLLNEDRSFQRWTAGAFPSLLNVASHYLFFNKILPKNHRINSLYIEDDIEYSKNVDWVSGACMIIRHSDIGEYIFDSSFFMYGEDMELCYRMKKQGGLVAYYPAASVVHYQGKSMEQQEGEILLQALKGPRNFYTSIHGTKFTILFDFFAVTGFLIRWLIYGVLSLVRQNKEYSKKMNLSLRHLKTALKVLLKFKN